MFRLLIQAANRGRANRLDGARALFVLSTGRAGTATLRKLFQLSPEAVAYHEPHPRLFAERHRLFQEGDVEAAWARKCVRRARMTAFLEAARVDKMYVETSAFLSFFTPILHELLPRARFIYIHRHPAGVIRSGMRRGWYDSHPGDTTRIRPHPESAAGLCWEKWSRFEKICWYWSAYNELCLTCVDKLPSLQCLKLSCHRLWGPQGFEVAREVFAFAGLSLPSPEAVGAVLQRPLNAQGESRFVSKREGDFPSIEQWSEAMKSQLAQIAGSTMKRLGYDLQPER